MGFNRRKMEDQRREAAEKEAATRRATDAQVLEDAERLIAVWNERQALTIGFCGYAAQLAGRSMQSICGHSIVTTTLARRSGAGAVALHHAAGQRRSAHGLAACDCG